MGTKFATLLFLAALCYGFAPLLAEAGRSTTVFGDIHFSQTSYGDGESAVVFILDGELSPAATCDATWSEIPSAVDVAEWWNFATGSPHAGNYALSEGCAFDTISPSKTPLRPSLPFWTVDVDGVDVLVANFDTATGRIALASDVNASSTLHALFEFDAVNSYPATSTLARMYSDSDSSGEPLPLAEVFSEIDSAPSPASALFRGSMLISTDPASQSPGDGRIWVRYEDSLYVDYFGLEGGETPVSSATAALTLDPPPPTPTPVPASSTLSLTLLGVAFAVLIWWRWTRSQRPSAEA